MTIEYTYNEEAAVKADEAASRLEHGVSYVGTFKKASDITAKSGSKGIELEFEAPGNGSLTFSLYTRNKDGGPIFGGNFVNAFMFFFGLKALRAEAGKVRQYDEEAREWVEVDGEVFPALCGKPVGLVFQKELYTTEQGVDKERLSLVGVFQPETRLMMSEIKERKNKPEKLDKLLKSLKVKDTRKKTAEPAQPAMGGVAAGDY